MSEKRPFRAECKSCEHRWIFAWLPMPLMTAAKLMKGLRCPYCGSDSEGIVALLPEAEDSQ